VEVVEYAPVCYAQMVFGNNDAVPHMEQGTLCL